MAPCHPDMYMVQPPPTLPLDEQPVSRTYQYRKVMKPMLERKRRARINRCLDELKELMVSALAAEGENVAKLEKADILELTVRHLHRLRRRHCLAATPEAAYADRFRAGFSQCAAEVSHFLSGSAPETAQRLLPHLGACLQACQSTSPTPDAANIPTPASSPVPSPAPSPAPAFDESDDSQEMDQSSINSSLWRPW